MPPILKIGSKVLKEELFGPDGKINPSLIPLVFDNIEKGYLHEGVFYKTRSGSAPDYTYSDPYTPQEEVLYVDKADGHKYLWNGDSYTDYDADIYARLVDVVNYVDTVNSNTIGYINQEIASEHEGRVAGDNLKANKDGYYQTLSAGYADKAGDLDSWASRDESPVENESTEFIRTTGGDESINGAAGAILLSLVCRGADFAPTRIISSGVNLLRLQSNNGVAVALGAGWYFPVPKLTATNESIGTSTENNGVLFVDTDGNNLTPTVRFKALVDGVPTNLNDGVVATYLDKNGRRHYTTSGEGYLIVSGITHASTCARIAWSTDYDKFVSPASELDTGTITSLTGIGTLRSVGLGGILVFDKAERISATQMRKTVNVGVSTNLTWTNIQEVDSEGEPTGNYTHTATITGMLIGGVADIKLSGTSEFFALAVEGNAVSFVDTNESVASGYSVKYQLEAPTTSNVNVNTAFVNISDWGIEYLEASGEGAILWRYAQGIPDSVYALLAKREIESEVIAQTFAYLKAEIDSLNERLKNYGDIIRMAVVDSVDYKTCGKPMFLECSTAGAPNASRIPNDWDEDEYGVWTGVPLAPHSFYYDITSKKVYFAPRCTNSTADWILLN